MCNLVARIVVNDVLWQLLWIFTFGLVNFYIFGNIERPRGGMCISMSNSLYFLCHVRKLLNNETSVFWNLILYGMVGYKRYERTRIAAVGKWQYLHVFFHSSFTYFCVAVQLWFSQLAPTDWRLCDTSKLSVSLPMLLPQYIVQWWYLLCILLCCTRT